MSETGALRRNIFYRSVEVLEQKIAVSSYYTVELACQNIDISPDNLRKEDLPKLINAILDIYKEYYPHRVADVGNHLNMILLQNEEAKPKKRRRWFFFK